MILFALFATAALISHYPETAIHPVKETLHGVTVVDPYRWLEEGTDPQVVAWTEQQNQFTKQSLDLLCQCEPLRQRYHALDHYEMSKTQKIGQGKALFVSYKSAEDEQWRFGYRAHREAPLQLLLDPNQWVNGETLEFAIPSSDGAYVAYGVAHGGDENPLIRILDVTTGQVCRDTLSGVCQGWPHNGVVWCPNHEGFYYAAYPDSRSKYWHAIYYHQLGTQADQDQKVFFDDSIKEHIHAVTMSDSGRFLAFTRTQSASGTEVYLSHRTSRECVPLATGFKAHYDVRFCGEQLLIITDEEAPNYRAFIVDPEQPERASWRELLPESSHRLLDVRGIGGYFYAVYLTHAHSQIHVFDCEGARVGSIPLPIIGTATVSGFWDQPQVQVDFTSFLHPPTRYHYEDPLKTTLCHEEAAAIPLDLGIYQISQCFFSSSDGTQVPMFLVAKKEQVNRRRPTLLTGYGGFGVSVTPSYSSFYLPFLEAGGILAIANLRGGGEYGEPWHQAGCKSHKQQVFDDFIAAAEWLINKGVTTADQLVIRGRSNGGLLVGAAMTQRPDLFRAVLCDVPLLDMIRYHKFGFSNIWASEYGSAENEAEFHTLMAYSPYHQVREGIRYPAVLIRGAQNDARTDPLHARKMAARLQAVDAGGSSKFLWIDSSGGHLGGATVSARIEQMTMAMAFLMDQLDLHPGETWPIEQELLETHR